MDGSLIAQAFSSEAPLWLRTWDALAFVLYYAPYWAPPFLGVILFDTWLKYIRLRFIAKTPVVLLEMRLPQEIFKTPAAMQAVLDSLHITSGESTFIARLWNGSVRTWYSFEIVSTEGQVHFYLWTRAAYRRHVERVLYSQYPDIELREVPDYTLAHDFNLETHDWFILDYELKQPDPLPIKTYVDFGLDSTMLKEELKVDPLANLLEIAGSMRKGEHFWLQILAQPQKGEDITYGLRHNKDTLDKAAAAYVTKIRSTPEESIVLKDGTSVKTLSQKQMDQIKAVHRTSLGGNGYNAGVRAGYIAERDVFDGTTIPALIRLFMPFSAPGSNQLLPNYGRWNIKFDHPWQDYKGTREVREKIRSLDAYRRRSWFHHPYKFKPFMFSPEELATLWHPVGSTATTPTIQRISSTRSEAPANLPI